MATHSSILAWRILWTEEPSRLQSMGSQRVGHNWVTFTSYFQTDKEHSKGKASELWLGENENSQCVWSLYPSLCIQVQPQKRSLGWLDIQPEASWDIDSQRPKGMEKLHVTESPDQKAQASMADLFICFIFKNWSIVHLVVVVVVTQLCPAVCNPMDCSLQSSSVHGILQAKIGALPNAGIKPRFPAWQVDSLQADPLGKHGVSSPNLNVHGVSSPI